MCAPPIPRAPAPVRMSPLHGNLGGVVRVSVRPPLQTNGGARIWVKGGALPIPAPPLVCVPPAHKPGEEEGAPTPLPGLHAAYPSHSRVTPHHSPVGAHPLPVIPRTACAPPWPSVLRKGGREGGRARPSPTPLAPHAVRLPVRAQTEAGAQRGGLVPRGPRSHPVCS
ncbi:hypothetical protein H4582DRAFT_2058485 [Lactarius indigo]|nr:hypothetical protein H4582DRAFT_2058485 [Lactarius indigo]